MKCIEIDLKNYNENGSIFHRTAVRGVVQKDGKYLVIHSNEGDYKFPGGGMEAGENLEATLIREMKEETGYEIVKESIRECVAAHEKRKGMKEEILEMDSYYFFCEVVPEAGERNLDDYEAEMDYQVAWITPEEMIIGNNKLSDTTNVPWVARDNMVMEYINSLKTKFLL